jgi:PPM family protein phosphatase
LVAGRASIVGAAATHVGKVREHNEDAHSLDLDLGVFLVCDGMGGHAAGEVASAIAIRSIRQEWASDGMRAVADHWLERGTPEAKKQLLDIVRAGVIAAHDAILAEAERDEAKSGMGTTLVGAMVIGGELVFAHAGDSRAYLVRDGISMQLTEDHTLLARLLAAGIDVDVSGEGSRFRSMLTNALGIGDECKVSTFVVPLADGDRFLLCSDGISEYVPENEVGDVLSRQATPARAAERLIELALERGGGDNATAVVVGVLEAGETPLPAEQRKKDDAAIGACALWGTRVTPQQRLRALRIAIPRDHLLGDKLPLHAMGDRVAWIVVEGELVQDGKQLGPGALLYPESLVGSAGAAVPTTDREAAAIARSDVRALAFRADDFRELCDEESELGEALLESLAQVIAKRRPRAPVRPTRPPVDPRGNTDPHLPVVTGADTIDTVDLLQTTDPNMPAADEPEVRERAATVPDDEPTLLRAQIPTRPWPQAESPIIAPVAPRTPPGQTSPPPVTSRRVSPPLPASPKRPSQPDIPVLPPPPAPALPPALAPALAPASPRSRPPTVPRPISPGAPAVRPTPTPAQAHAAAALPHTPSAVHGIPKAPVVTPRSAVRTPTFPPPAGTPTGMPARTKGERPSTSPPVAAGDRAAIRPPSESEPEIEAYFEIEAELPPEAGSELDRLESELALSLALGSERYADEHESVSITIEEDSLRVTKTVTVTETDSQVFTLTVTEPGALDPARPRAITAEDGNAVSGTIVDPSSPPRRARRHSEGYEE